MIELFSAIFVIVTYASKMACHQVLLVIFVNEPSICILLSPCGLLLNKCTHRQMGQKNLVGFSNSTPSVV